MVKLAVTRNMSRVLVKEGYNQARKLLFIQILIVIFLAIAGLFKEFMVAVALLSGGVAVLVSNAYFVYKAFSSSGASATKKVVRSFYLGETVKIVLSALLVIAGFLILPGFEIYVLTGYIAASLTQWLAPIVIKTH